MLALLEAGTVEARALRHMEHPAEVPAARPARAPPAHKRRRIRVTRPSSAPESAKPVERHRTRGARLP